jgi:hypothetical protein
MNSFALVPVCGGNNERSESNWVFSNCKKPDSTLYFVELYYDGLLKLVRHVSGRC